MALFRRGHRAPCFSEGKEEEEKGRVDKMREEREKKGRVERGERRERRKEGWREERERYKTKLMTSHSKPANQT